MEAQLHPQTMSEQIVDDPLAPLRLPPLAQISEFWKRYDRAADIHDRKMTSNLNGNLDVLLIFAALFSAINTTFISITMPDLSPNPSDETNTLLRLLVMKADNNTLSSADLSPPFSPNSTSIIVNCLLYASLSCSLLAAVGAMMAKEWLQSFDRTGQTGPLEEQGRLRQRKFNGVEQWHLEAVIESLPNLLLLSVLLFFAGIGLFLVPINTAVAGIVIAFSGLGVGLSSIAIVAGAISPLCPYQSAASSALRRIAKTFRDLWRKFSQHPIVRATQSRLTTVQPRTPRAVTRTSQLFGRAFHVGVKMVEMIFPALTRRNNASNGTGAIAPRHSSQRENKGDNEQIVTAQAARWLIDTTSNREDQISTAQMIRTLDRKARALVFEDSRTWQRLLSLTREAFDTWKFQPTDRNQEIAELFGLALCHVPQLSSRIFPSESLTDLGSNQSSSLGETFLKVLQLACINYSNQAPEDEECILHVAFLYANIRSGTVILEYQWAKLARWLLVGKAPISDALLAAWAFVVRSITFSFSRYMTSVSFMELGEDKKFLARWLSNVLEGSDISMRTVRQSSQSELSAMHCYAACLRRAGELAQQTDSFYLDQAVWGVVDLIRTYVDDLTKSNIGEISLELVGLSVEVVLGLHTLIQARKRSGQKQVPLDNGPRHGPLLDDRLVKAVVDLIQEDLRPDMEEISRSARRSIIRVLLWVWKNTPVDQITDFWKDQIFASTCLLWGPLEKEVDFQAQGNYNRHKPFTPKEMSGIVEFIQFIKEGRESSAFISRNADVGINRIYVHFAQRVDWEYELFKVGEQSEWCSRAWFIEDELL